MVIYGLPWESLQWEKSSACGASGAFGGRNAGRGGGAVMAGPLGMGGAATASLEMWGFMGNIFEHQKVWKAVESHEKLWKALESCGTSINTSCRTSVSTCFQRRGGGAGWKSLSFSLRIFLQLTHF